MSNGSLRRLVATLVLAVLSLAAFGRVTDAAERSLTVFAASSLRGPLDEVARAFRADHAADIRISYAGSSKQARQIQFGAPAQVYLSASPDWMDLLERDGLLAAGTRHDLLTNAIVLIAAPDFTAPLQLGPDMNLAEALGDGLLAMALVDAVPAGQYGRAALESLGQWDSVATRIVQTDNVRSALHLVARGEAPLGIVYRTDALAEPAVRIVGTFPASSHPPIRYPVAVVAPGDTELARDFLRFLLEPQAAGIFRDAGFGLVADGS